MSGNEEERPERPSEVDGTAHLFQALGKILKVLRRNAGLSQAELSDLAHCSEDLISSVERGVRTPQPDFLVRVDPLVKADGVLAVAADDVRKALARARVRHPDWFRDFAHEEAKAVALHYYAVQAVPGVLQTPAYARSLFEHRRPMLDEATIEKRVADRISRQVLLDQWPAPTVSFVLEAAVLLRPFGGPKVHREQLLRILEVARRRTVELQIMPQDKDEHPYLDGAFTLLTARGRREVAYTEIYGHSRLITDPEEVRAYTERYGIIRAQALTPRESLDWIEKLLGER
ncbi:transcriptional regulator [Streptomyces cinereoruber]|uniref:Transcriptional regulator n=1 Tax=Streptomyces cinereoruber TaxID=67260 RepID=A0AAV4KB18_9ACTN|nr:MULTISPECIES: helix-turn-helix transcriptional regulator [Streptomyces]MBB4156921.1 transcriptional regulator with XRE-family HTH domain [Streptomyces cinereoruber]MBY8815259.1 helix-turn-helix transcriptional regulator [Streptomyces cinereoruber]NIH59981.1 transcriptional regulator with XRE-family HTH domain [Streptomyces cinereoruber]PVC74448.1 transcriptional regulator [Streptomyces sp. CS081A]QEV34173.1 XRE family transcriptional regulator [Streptomyces cinereoruber]